jgi:hypothetical protein
MSFPVRCTSPCVFVVVLVGCMARQSEVSNKPEAPSQVDWTPPVKSVDTALLSPQESKALLAALAFVYERDREAHLEESQILKTQCTQQIDGSYEVRIFYVGFWLEHVPGPMLGGFEVFYLDKNWKIVRSIGGA